MANFKRILLKELKVLSKFISTFGLLKGLTLYQKFKSKNVGHLVLPGIRYPIGLRKDITDFKVFNQIFLDADDSFLLKIRDPAVIIDGGANIGLNAIKLTNRFPNAKIICVEPDPENFKALQNNIKPYKYIIADNSALWHKNTKLKIYDKFSMGKWAMTVEEDVENGTVKGEYIENLMTRYGIDKIDILKLDIETSEKNLFSENYKSWLSKTRLIIIELHDRMLPGCSKTFFEAINATFNNYEYSHSGEYTIIVNKDLEM